MELADGRRLAYSEYGDPAGMPVINCHGGLTSRRDIEGCEESARAAGVRVISPDRPGIGRSDPKPGRTLLDWPADVVALVDALGVERFAVLGWSLGGAYAAACAFALRERISAVALVASAIPGDWCRMEREINLTDRVFMRLSARAPRVLHLVLRANGMVAHRAQAIFRRFSLIALDKPSRKLVMSAPASAFSGPIAEGLRDPVGVLDDYRILRSPWGFDPAEIQQPVHIWQGDSWAERLATRIPNADLRICSGEGHFLALERYPEIFTTLNSAKI